MLPRWFMRSLVWWCWVLACFVVLSAFRVVDAQTLPTGTGGFPNEPQVPGTLLSGLLRPEQGRTAIFAYHGGVLFSIPELPSSQPNSDFQVRTWDIADPRNPVELSQLGVSPMPVNAHGYFQSGEYLVMGPNLGSNSPWTFRAQANGTLTRGQFPGFLGIGERGSTFWPWNVGPTYRLYFPCDPQTPACDAYVERNGQRLATYDHLNATGVLGHPFLLGNLLIYAAEESRTGVATYDISNPAQPVLLDVLRAGGPGGYWPELWAGGGRLYVIFPYRLDGNGIRVVDVTDPTDIRFVTDRPLPGATAQYAQFQDEFGFIGDHKVDMRTFESVLFFNGATVPRTEQSGTGIDISQFALPLGNLLVTGGIGVNQGMAIWAHQAEPDLRGPSVAYHVPRAGQTNYPVGAPISLIIHETLNSTTVVSGTTLIVRPVGGNAITGRIAIAFDDIVTFTPDQPLAANTTYEVVVPAGGIRDAVGNGAVEHRFTFSTGAALAGNQPPSVASLVAGTYPALPAQSLELVATATDPEAGALEYRFDFGDGSPTTPWTASATAQHAYADVGHYTATVQVRDAQLAIASAATRVTVVNAPAATRPTQSATILCDTPRRRVWVVDPDNAAVVEIDPDTRMRLRVAPVCAGPRAVTRSAAGELWVACEKGDELRVLDEASLAERARIAAGYGAAPVAVVAAPDGTRVYAAFQGRRQVVQYDATSRAELARVTLDAAPRAIAVSANGAQLVVTRFRATADQAETWRFSTSPFATSGRIAIPRVGGEGNADTQASGRGIPNHLVGVALAPDELGPGAGVAWIAANKQNTARGPLVGPDLAFENTVRNLVVGVDPATLAVRRAIDLDNSDSASAVTFSPLGDYLFVALQGNDALLALDALTLGAEAGSGSIVGRFPVGAAPQGVCVDAQTRRTFVHDFLGRSVTALETDAFFEEGDLTFPRQTIALGTSETLDASVLAGKRIFYAAGDPRMSSEGYLSCATCHLDGAHDGRTWDFSGRGEGLRNTADLRGRAGLGHGNVHWSANFDEIQDFENDIRLAFGGTGFLSDAQFDATAGPLGPPKAGLSAALDALADYVASLGNDTLPKSPFRTTTGAPTAAAQRGASVFGQLGCGACHAGTTFTESQSGAAPPLRDVGTLRTTSGSRLGTPLAGIDTPTLLGLWDTPPYLHDGTAERVEDVFTALGGRVVAAEAGTVSGGAMLQTQFTDTNNDDTVRGRAYAIFGPVGSALNLVNVDAGAGGVGALELRYSAAQAGTLEVVVNGTTYAASYAASGNVPAFRRTRWFALRIANVAWNAGATNAVTVRTTGGPGNSLGVDELLVTTPAEIALAQPHRVATTLAAADRADLVEYLLSLDGTDAANGLFSDGFE